MATPSFPKRSSVTAPPTRRIWSPLLGALVPIAVAFSLVGSGSWFNRHTDIGYTSRWHVPTSVVHEGLRYSLVRPVRCLSARSIGEPQRQPDGSTLGLRLFASDLAPDLVLYLQPKGDRCLVAYEQHAVIG